MQFIRVSKKLVHVASNKTTRVRARTPQGLCRPYAREIPRMTVSGASQEQNHDDTIVPLEKYMKGRPARNRACLD